MASVKNYELNLKAGEEYEFPVRGNSVRYVSSKLDAPIYLKSANGLHDFYLEVGQRINFSNDTGFLNFVVYTKTGVDHKIVLQVSEDAFVDSSRVAGEVSVINGEVSRVLRGQSYFAYQSCLGVAAQYSHVQIKNPVGSGKNLIINKITAQADVAGRLLVSAYDVNLLNISGGFLTNKLIGGGASVAELRHGNNAVPLGVPIYVVAVANINEFREFEFSEPIILASGKGLLVNTNDVNIVLRVNFQYNEVDG